MKLLMISALVANEIANDICQDANDNSMMFNDNHPGS